jgi:hypothetical protein
LVADAEPPEPEGPAASTSGNAFETPLTLSSSSALMSTLPGRLWMLSASLRGEKGRSVRSTMRIPMSDCASQIVKLEPLPDVADAGTETHLMVNRSPSRCRSGGTGSRRVRARLPSPIQASAASSARRCAEGAVPHRAAVHIGKKKAFVGFSDLGIGDLWLSDAKGRHERGERAEIRLLKKKPNRLRESLKKKQIFFTKSRVGNFRSSSGTK